jgi:hypothetical protein
MSARTGIHGRDKLEARREVGLPRRAGDAHPPGFERLAQRFEHVPVELGQLVEKQHAVVGKRNFAGSRKVPAADQGNAGGTVVRRTERPLAPAQRVEPCA